MSRFVSGLEAAANGRFLRTNWEETIGGAYSTFAPGQITAAEFQSWIEGANGTIEREVRSGGIYFAGEHLSDVYCGFMNGAAETGRLAAQAILQRSAAPQALFSRRRRRVRAGAGG